MVKNRRPLPCLGTEYKKMSLKTAWTMKYDHFDEIKVFLERLVLGSKKLKSTAPRLNSEDM